MVLWTESGIRRVATDVATEVISGARGADSTRKHIVDVLRGPVLPELGAELRAQSEKLVDDAKSSLHKKLNAIFNSQREKLANNIRKFESELEESEPNLNFRLKNLKSRISEIEKSCEEWLESPKQQLEDAASEQLGEFSYELDKLIKVAEMRLTEVTEQVEQQLEELVHDRLQNLLLQAVRQHVTSKPYSMEKMSNKQISKLKRISLREVKRRRQAGMYP